MRRTGTPSGAHLFFADEPYCTREEICSNGSLNHPSGTCVGSSVAAFGSTLLPTFARCQIPFCFATLAASQREAALGEDAFEEDGGGLEGAAFATSEFGVGRNEASFAKRP